MVYCPDAATTLVSTHKLTAIGYTVLMDNTGGTITKDNETAVKLVKKNTYWTFTENMAMHVNLSPELTLLHRQLGHLRSKNLKYLVNPKNNLLESYKFPTDQIDCVPCVEANLKKRQTYGKRDYTKTKHILDLAHIDLCGPMSVPSINGELYFVTFTDDHTRYITLYLLKTKMPGFYQALVKHVASIQTTHSKTLKAIQCDLGSEFINGKVREFLEKNGTKIHTSPRDTPQLNGVAESANNIILTKARGMLADTQLPKNYWGYAVQTAAILKNVSPTAVKPRLPWEHWHGIKPDLTKLRVFGCSVFFYDPDRKMDFNAKRGVFVGYTHDLANYQVLDLQTRKVKISNNVKFDENVYPSILYNDPSRIIESDTSDDDYVPPQTRRIQNQPIQPPAQPAQPVSYAPEIQPPLPIPAEIPVRIPPSNPSVPSSEIHQTQSPARTDTVQQPSPKANAPEKEDNPKKSRGRTLLEIYIW